MLPGGFEAYGRVLPPIWRVEADRSVRDGRSWDVFISHAGEDKDDVARPLFVALHDLGVSVWFDEAELRIGDSLRQIRRSTRASSVAPSVS